MSFLQAWNEATRLRAGIMTEGLDLAHLHGLEIGALSHPMVSRAHGPVTYVDYTDAGTLRRMYAGAAHVDVDAIVEVDAIWGEQTLRDCLGGRTVDYVMASHVAEHVPDLVTWLAETRDVLNPGGQLRLTLPDKRFSHDALREETRFSDLVAAWLLRARRPQMRDVLDFRLHTASSVDGGSIYAGSADPSAFQPDHPFQVAVDSAKVVLEHPSAYLDVHCLVARACAFAKLMERLASVGLLRMACARMIDTLPPLFEFYVFMTPCEDQTEVERSWRDVQATLRDPLPGSAAALAAERAVEESRAAARALADSEAERSHLAAHLAEATAALQAIQHSRSWRVTAPLRRLLATFQGRAS